MSETSQSLLNTSNKGVHEQLDMLVAAMQTQSVLLVDTVYSELDGKSLKEINAWVRDRTARHMGMMEYSTGFLMKRLLLYVYQLYEPYYGQYRTVLPFKEDTSLEEIQHSILVLAASALDAQFSEEGRADICAFLKQDAGARTNENSSHL